MEVGVAHDHDRARAQFTSCYVIIIITRARAQFSANHEMTACYVAFLKKHNSATTGIATVW